MRVYLSRLSQGSPKDNRERLDPGERILSAKLKGLTLVVTMDTPFKKLHRCHLCNLKIGFLIVVPLRLPYCRKASFSRSLARWAMTAKIAYESASQKKLISKFTLAPGNCENKFVITNK